MLQVIRSSEGQLAILDRIVPFLLGCGVEFRQSSSHLRKREGVAVNQPTRRE